jgi:hypothetical protein
VEWSTDAAPQQYAAPLGTISASSLDEDMLEPSARIRDLDGGGPSLASTTASSTSANLGGICSAGDMEKNGSNGKCRSQGLPRSSRKTGNAASTA